MMKKKYLNSLLLICVMSFLLCACGETGKSGGDSSNSKVEDSNSKGNFLTDNTWKDINDESNALTFNEDGTGTYYGMNTTWILNENYLSISFQNTAGIMTIEFDIVENDGLKMIIERPNNYINAMILVVSDDYENQCQKAKDYFLTHAEVLDWEAVYDEMLENEVRASANHSGKIVKWSAKVYEITEYFCRMAIKESGYSPLNPIDVYMSTKELIKFDKFDEITVVGILELDGIYCSSITGAFVVEE